MDIQVTGRHLTVSQETRDFVQEKAGKLEKYFDRITRIEVILDGIKKKGEYRAEVIVHAPRGAHLVSHASESSVNAAVDSGMHKMERQLNKFKDKMQDKSERKKTGRFLKQSAGPNPEETPDENW